MTLWCSSWAAMFALGCGGGDLEKSIEELSRSSKEQAATIESLTKRVVKAEGQLACVDAQRTMRGAWYAHYNAASRSAGRCRQVGNVCAQTGLPPNTLTRYKFKILAIARAMDESLDQLKVQRAALPKLPKPTVKSKRFERMFETRAAAEEASDTMLKRCGSTSAKAKD